MLIAFDIGNTTISAGIIKNGKVIHRAQVLTAQKKTELSVQLHRLLGQLSRPGWLFQGAMITSVVPEVTKVVERETRAALKITVQVVGRDVVVPIKNLYHKPEQVGQDRLLCSYVAAELYGAPVIILDLGTAITVDVVSPRGAYLGGMIIPGLRLSAEALFQKTALLPKVEIRKPRRLIGKDTEGSILSGLFYGYGAMLNGVIAEIADELKKPVQVVLTGGYVDVMKSFLRHTKSVVDRDLIFKGMWQLWSNRTAEV